jgi:signal transduction histidine kinase
MVHRDGPVRYLEAQAVAVEDFSGGQASILLTSRDVSARKEAEAQKALMEIELRHAQKMEAIGQLAAGIAHEINTPCQYLNDNLGFLAEAFGSLQAVMGALGAFLDQAPAGLDLSGPRKAMVEQDVAYFLDEAPRAIGQSRDGLARISTIVKAMKIFAHPGEEGRVPVNLNEALENTLVVAQGEWKYVAEVDRDFAPDLPAIVGSAGELNEVFLHLIVNAAQAIAEKGEAGKGRITVATRALEEGVEIRIRDTGMGIPDAIRDRVFLPFFSTKPVGKGTGQGLSIVHSVIAKHGGTVAFESEPGQGACFIIHLPLGA